MTRYPTRLHWSARLGVMRIIEHPSGAEVVVDRHEREERRTFDRTRDAWARLKRAMRRAMKRR